MKEKIIETIAIALWLFVFAASVISAFVLLVLSTDNPTFPKLLLMISNFINVVLLIALFNNIKELITNLIRILCLK